MLQSLLSGEPAPGFSLTNERMPGTFLSPAPIRLGFDLQPCPRRAKLKPSSRRKDRLAVARLFVLTLALFAICVSIAFGTVAIARSAGTWITVPVSTDGHGWRVD